ncbi:hypothetical protein [Winogradskyella wichelsiae]|uniref:hypothetical protein n=1 Tax=Winogradskyella wichelsiae TaxID=2697007 RepID=UPI0015CD003A|nr:hypothetical protein [Winogradskyella wichelsiae]
MIVILISIGSVIFIIHTNDHEECELKTEINYGENEEKIVSEIHICKEKYNL